MGWFWGSSQSNENDKSKDPLRNLDPSLREFLSKASPVKYDTSNTQTTQPAPEVPRAVQETRENTKSSSVPSKSLYADGRYAHLWKTYQSQEDVENTSKSEQEKISDVLEGFKYRKAEIGRAAVENCALEQEAVNDCFKTGGWQARVTMCRDENRKFERCYLMQAKFLKALGYLSAFDRPPEVDEQIQMHADTLYHRMLEQEEAIEAAKKEGKPAPVFPPLLSSRPKISGPLKDPENTKLKATDLSPSVQAGLKERLDGLSAEERELEERAIKAEIQAGEEVAERLGRLFQQQQEERKLRKEQGAETMGDRIRSLFGSR